MLMKEDIDKVIRESFDVAKVMNVILDEIQKAFDKGFDLGVKVFSDAGRVKWHDMRKTPEDLPETLHPVYAKLDSGTYVFAYCVNKIWYDNDGGTILCYGNGECEVIAWTEIPRFEET